MITIGRTWELWAHRYANGKLWNVGKLRWVELHLIKEPIVPVLVEEVIGDPLVPEVSHYAWEANDTPRTHPAMIQIRTGAPNEPSRAMMFLDMCFPYGLKAEVAAGRGKVLALRITERVEDP